jgi:hypothetical protein
LADHEGLLTRGMADRGRSSLSVAALHVGYIGTTALEPALLHDLPKECESYTRWLLVRLRGA